MIPRALRARRRLPLLSGIAVLAVAGLIAQPAVAAPAALSSPRTAAVATPVIDRLAGATRYDTSVAVSQEFDPGVPALFVATGTDFPDALAAAAGAAALGGPLLLTQPTVLPAVVEEEIRRMAPGKIFVMGGSGAVSDRVLSRLSAIAPTQRIGGQDRYQTAERLIDQTFPRPGSIVIATGRGFADALAAGAAAGGAGIPLLLVDGSRSTLPPATLQALQRWGVGSVSIAGGHGAVDIRIEQQLRTAGYEVSRHAGGSRYETAVALHDAYFSDAAPPAIFLATGGDFPDALSAAALAGSQHAPLLLTRPDCVPARAHATLAASTAPARIVVGGESVVSPAAAANTACAGPAPVEQTWATTGWAFDPSAAAPYSDRPPVDVTDQSIRLDETGLRIYTTLTTRERADHPVAYAQYGISALMEYQRTGEQVWLDRATRHAERLTQMRTERAGAWWFPYLFPWTYYQRTMSVPWWSGMAQGEALSLFTRLFEETADQRWQVAADRTWQSFLQPRDGSLPWSTFVHRDLLFFEEYAGNQPPLLVLNGQIFALFGVYDYWRLTGDADAARYLDGGATTVLAIMPEIRQPGGVSYYCAQEGYCRSPLWQNAAYHVIHSWQLDTLARLSGDDAFSEWAQLLREDWQPAARFATTPSMPLGWENGPPQ